MVPLLFKLNSGDGFYITFKKTGLDEIRSILRTKFRESGLVPKSANNSP